MQLIVATCQLHEMVVESGFQSRISTPVPRAGERLPYTVLQFNAKLCREFVIDKNIDLFSGRDL